MTGDWKTQPGERLTRAQLAARYGGNPRAGRIMASDATANVLLFADPVERSRPWEFNDGPTADGSAWAFTGRGPVGDQRLPANRALWDHLAQGRALRLFVSEGFVPGTRAEAQRYIGEFRIDPAMPYRRERAVDRHGLVRWVLVFRLLPVGRDLPPGGRPRAAGARPRPAGPRPRAADVPASASEVRLPRSCNIVAHLDDDLLFLNPALQVDLDNGWGVRTIVLTAGDAGLAEEYWLGREDGLRAAYAHMAGMSDDWVAVDAGVPGRGVTVESLVGNPAVQLVFLRLPDGNIDGSGFSSTGRVSLQQLWTGNTASCTTVDVGETYTAAELVSALVALLGDPEPAVVRMLDFVGHFGDGDHSDHHASAYFALAATREAGLNRRVGHRGYPIARLPQNVGASLVARKRATFLAYAAHDPQVPLAAPDLGDYGPWLARRYTCGTGNIAALASVTASSANAATGQVAARAVDGWALGDDDATHEWATLGGGADSWLALAWPTSHTVRRVVLYDRANPDDHVLAGRVVLPDGQEFPTGALGGRYEPTTVELPDVDVTALRFVVDEVAETTGNVGLAEIEVLEANLAPDAVASASSENQVTGQVARCAVDGVAAGYPEDPQREWATLGGGVGIAPRVVSWLVLTVTGVSPTTRNVGLAEIRVEGS